MGGSDRDSQREPSSSRHPPQHRSGGSPSALLAFGFRPFFLLAGTMAALGLVLWILQLQGFFILGGAYGFVGWHAHEMLFGYTVAVIAGFLLTAVRNWTRGPTASGRRLLALATLWLTGRIVMLAADALPPIVVAAVDLAFLPALAAALAPSLWRTQAWRNLALIGLLAVIALANLGVHLQALGVLTGGARMGYDVGLGAIVLMMVVVGGRVVPAFTRNALPRLGVRDWAWVSRLAIALTALHLLCVVLPLGRGVAGAVTLAAALANGVRMVPWGSLGARGAPILWVLHLGYAWIVAGLAVTGAAAFVPWVPTSAGTHALGVGAIGTLTLGMMSRVALGHTGRALTVGSPIVLAYVLVTLGAATRVTAAFFPAQFALLMIAALAWALAFAIFTAVYWPILTRPRIDGRPG